MKNKFLRTFAPAVVLGSALVLAPAVSSYAQSKSNSNALWPLAGASNRAGTNGMSIDPSRGVMTLAPLLERTTPAVVNISVSSKVKMPSSSRGGMAGDEFMERFFGNRAGRGNNREQENKNNRDDDQPDERTKRSAGSGVIINAGKGYVLTNHHVIDGADKIMVNLKDRRTAEATLIGSDPATDVALLKIDLRNLTDITMADSDQVKVGDYVIAIGNAFGIGQSVTTGIVSALGRSTRSREKYQDYIQTDAAINQGNSGGALINSKGELVGMNTAILSRSGGSNGIGFAVPTNMISNIMDQLVSYGEVRRGRIGVSIQNITPELMAAMNLRDRNGALVGQVVDDSPAKKAGLKAGDVIVSFNGQDIIDSDDIRNAVGFVERGTRASITYLRDGKRYTTKIKVEKAPDTPDAVDEEESEENVGEPAVLEAFDGAKIRNIPSELDPDGGDDGVLISRVRNGSDAWEAGLRRGDIIRSVDSRTIHNLDDFEAALARKSGAHFLSVQRGRARIFIAVK